MAGGTGVTPGTIDIMAGSWERIAWLIKRLEGFVPEEQGRLMQRQMVVKDGEEHSARDRPDLQG